MLSFPVPSERGTALSCIFISATATVAFIKISATRASGALWEYSAKRNYCCFAFYGRSRWEEKSTGQDIRVRSPHLISRQPGEPATCQNGLKPFGQTEARPGGT